MSYCDDLSQAASLVKEARAELEARIVNGIENIIDFPVHAYKESKEGKVVYNERYKNLVDLAKKTGDKRDLAIALKRENARYKAHLELYNYLIDSSKDYLYKANSFVIPSDFISDRLNLIQSMFQNAYSEPVYKNMQNPGASGLNDSTQWDAGKIRYISKMMKKKEGLAAKGGLTAVQNTIMQPLRVAQSLDQSGSANTLGKMSESLLDTYRQKGYKWRYSIVDPYTGQKNPISLDAIDGRLAAITAKTQNVPGLPSLQILPAITQLSEELLHGEVRNILPREIPTNPAEFTKWRNSWAGKQFFKMINFESERHNIGDTDARYVMIPLHSDKVGVNWLKKQRKLQIKQGVLTNELDPGENENGFLVYRIPDNIKEFFASIRKNNLITEESLKKHLPPASLDLDEGFYTAQQHKVFKYEMIPNSENPKRKWADFTRGVNFQGNVYDPPLEWMPEMWESIDMQREWNDLFYEKELVEETRELNSEYADYRIKVQQQLIRNGLEGESVEEILDKIDSLGGMEFNITEDKDGNFVSSNSFVRKASKWSYGHIKFYDTDYRDMLDKARTVIRDSYVPEFDAQLATDNSVLESEDADAAEKAEAVERISSFEKRRKHYSDMLAHMDTKIYGESDSDLDERKMFMSDRILAAKARTLFTDHKRRIKDRSVHKEYVDMVMRNNELTRIKIQLFKTALANKDNPDLVNFMIDQIKTTAGDVDIEAGFGKAKYGDRGVANLFGENVTAENIRDIGLIHRGIGSGFNLGMWTAMQNNTQVLNAIINYGWEPYVHAFKVVQEGDSLGNFTAEDIKEQVRETGVLEPGNAFIDMLTMGMQFGEDIGIEEMFMPVVDMARLFKATTLDGWLNQSKTWDKLIKSARKRSTQEAIKTTELKNVKTELYNVIHGDFKDKPKEIKMLKKRLLDLRIGLTLSNVNRLVKWKLQWFPTGPEWFSMAGTEERMRTEIGYMGLRRAYDMGLIEVPTEAGKKWKYTDSQRAVNMARLYVYNNLFGFTKVMIPKAMRGAIGGGLFQWKQYDYHQTISEYEWLRSAALSKEYAQESDLKGWGMLALRIPAQIMKKAIRQSIKTGVPMVSPSTKKYWTKFLQLNPEHDDKNLDRAATFFITRGLATIASAIMWTQWAPYTFLSSTRSALRMVFRDKITQRGLGGAGSPLIGRALTLSMLLLMIGEVIRRGDDDDFVEDILRQYMSKEIVSLYLWISNFEKNKYRGLRPFLPTPVKELAPGAPYTERMYEMLDDFTSF